MTKITAGLTGSMVASAAVKNLGGVASAALVPIDELALGLALLGSIPEGMEEVLDQPIQLENRDRRAPKPVTICRERAPVAFGDVEIPVAACEGLLDALSAAEEAAYWAAREQVQKARRIAKRAAQEARRTARLEREATEKMSGLQNELIHAMGAALVDKKNLAAMRLAKELANRIHQLKKFAERARVAHKHFVEVLRRERAEGWGEYPPKWLDELSGLDQVIAA